MGRSKYLDKRAKEIIRDKMRDAGEMSVEEIMDLIRPHFLWDGQAARERDIRRQANVMVRSLKDEQNVRSCFKLDGTDLYVNIDRCDELPKVRAISNQLHKKIQGMQASHRKTEIRQQELEGQTSMFANSGSARPYAPR